jgi:hypothetical protein
MLCKFCGSEFEKAYPNQRYCCDECRVEAKKRQDQYNSRRRYTLRQQQQEPEEGVCEYCGKSFIKQHGNQKYCSKTCSDNKNRETNADSANRHYHHVKKLRGGDTVWGLGSGRLGPHRYEDYDLELEKIQKEFIRLNLSAK